MHQLTQVREGEKCRRWSKLNPANRQIRNLAFCQQNILYISMTTHYKFQTNASKSHTYNVDGEVSAAVIKSQGKQKDL